MKIIKGADAGKTSWFALLFLLTYFEVFPVDPEQAGFSEVL